MSKDKYTISVQEAADRLDVSKKTIYRKCRNEKLDAIKKKNSQSGQLQWFISKDDPEFSKQAEVINEVVEVEEKIDLPELKGAMKEVFQQTIQTAMAEEREKIKKEVRQEVKKEMQNEREEIKKEIRQEIEEGQEVQRKWINARDERLMKVIREIQKKNKEQNKGLLDKIIDLLK